MSAQKQWRTLPLFFLASIAALGFGGLFTPGEWYEGLNRAPWSPPNIAFPIVWTILYALIAVAGWLIFNSNNKTLKSLWVIQLIFNVVWSWIFFGQHSVLLGLIDIMLLDTLVALLILLCFRNQLKTAALLLIPYLIWLTLATTLNAYILVAN